MSRRRRCQVNEQGAQFVRSGGAAAGSARTRHHVPVGERSRAKQSVVKGPQQVAADPEKVLHEAVDRREPLKLADRLEASHLAFTMAGRL